MSASKNSQSQYAIGAVSRLTGLTTHTIRMWEHRYDAVVPERGANGRRIYDARDVEKLSMLKALTDQGHAISTVAGLSHDQLREQMNRDRELSAQPEHRDIDLAIMGPGLFSAARSLSDDDGNIRTLALAVEPMALVQELAGRKPDALVAEFPVLDTHAASLMTELISKIEPGQAWVAYRYARRQVLQQLAENDIGAIRSPLSPDGLKALLTSDLGNRSPSKHIKRADDKPARTDREAPAEPRFNLVQLAQLERLDSSIECECPRHLAEILSALGAFERYSNECADLDPEQARLHAYLADTTGHARVDMERALEHLLDVEQIHL